MPREKSAPIELGGDERYFETSFLKTIPKEEPLRLSPKNPLEKCSGVEGCSPKKYMPYQHPPKEVVPGSVPRTSIRSPKNRPCYALRNDDIDLSSPSYDGFSTKRCINPLQPEYHLPAVPLESTSPTKFLRDTLNIGDIPGARSKIPYQKYHRETNYVGDLDGAQPAIKYLRLRAVTENSKSDVRDITHDYFQSSRNTNLMSPRYRYNVPPPEYFIQHPSAPYQRETWVIGDVPGNHPATIPPLRSTEFCLKTEDIDGCHPRKPLVRRQWNATNYIGDIEGSAPKLSRGFQKQLELEQQQHNNHHDSNSNKSPVITAEVAIFSTPPSHQQRSRLPSLDQNNNHRSHSSTNLDYIPSPQHSRRKSQSLPNSPFATRSPTTRSIDHKLLSAFADVETSKFAAA